MAPSPTLLTAETHTVIICTPIKIALGEALITHGKSEFVLLNGLLIIVHDTQKSFYMMLR